MTDCELMQQEPVAWIHEWAQMNHKVINAMPPSVYGEHWTHTPLYATPPRRDESTICRECAKYEARTFELERALRDAAYHCHEIHRRGGTAWDCWYELQAKGKG